MNVIHPHPHGWQSHLAVRVGLVVALLLFWLLAFAASLG